MQRYAKIIFENQVSVFEGTDIEWATSQGFTEQDVEKGYDGNWYLAVFTPTEPEKTYVEKRVAEYPPLGEQLDMIYWDRVNNTNLWQSKISEIKAKYPKV